MRRWVALALVLAPGTAAAQAPPPIDCSYDECALRVKQTLFGQDLVRGLGEERANGLGFWIGDLDDAFAGSRVAQELAESFRRRHNVGQTMLVAGLIAMFASLYSLDWDSYGSGSDAAGPLLVGGAALGVAGALIDASGRDRLHRAIFEYNRALAR